MQALSMATPFGTACIAWAPASQPAWCMVCCRQWKTYKLTKGAKFALERKKPATDLTYEMLAK